MKDLSVLIAFLNDLITLKFDTKPPMQVSSNSLPNASTATPQAYSPSVPLIVYRDLAAQLQTTEAMLDALTAKNQQLVQENQFLRQEISQAVQSVLRLQKMVESYTKPTFEQTPLKAADLNSQPPQRVTVAPPKQRLQTPRKPVVPPRVEKKKTNPQPVFIEEQEVRYYPRSESEPKAVGGWWLILAIFLIVFTAFGTGYWVVRPMFEHRNR